MLGFTPTGYIVMILWYVLLYLLTISSNLSMFKFFRVFENFIFEGSNDAFSNNRFSFIMCYFLYHYSAKMFLLIYCKTHWLYLSISFHQKLCKPLRQDLFDLGFLAISNSLSGNILSEVALFKKCPYSELFWSAFFPHFSAFGLNMERYGLPLRIQSKCEKLREKSGPE